MAEKYSDNSTINRESSEDKEVKVESKGYKDKDNDHEKKGKLNRPRDIENTLVKKNKSSHENIFEKNAMARKNQPPENKDTTNKSTEYINTDERQSNVSSGDTPVLQPEFPTPRERKNASARIENSTLIANAPMRNPENLDHAHIANPDDTALSRFKRTCAYAMKRATFSGIVVSLLMKCMLTFLGFEPSGIQRKSYAASMMSLTTRNGFGKSIVSFLQSCGTGGFWMYLTIAIEVAIVVALTCLCITYFGGRGTRAGEVGEGRHRNE